MYLGCAWYPEQWPEDRWETDLQLMQSAGMNVVRIGEYAWSALEPREGRHEVEWLERAVDLAARHDIEVVLCTPTDAPPAWLTQKYPDVLRVDEHGKRLGHGSRRHFSPLSGRYREMCRGISTVMARHFGSHPNVIGWQICNEYCMPCHSESTRVLFQQWVAQRYGTLETLNRHWTTRYWSEEYSDWSQIPLPSGWPHPGLQLEFFRFMSRAFRDFQKVQIDAIRDLAEPRQWISHNLHCYEDLDFTEISEDLDRVGWDPYPGGRGAVEPHRIGLYSDFCRTLKDKPHWIAETQPGHVNWSPPNLSLPKGGVRALAWHFYAHGAEAVLFWQWRAALCGQEQYHGTLVAPDGNPRPLFAEVAKLGRELKQFGSVLSGMRPRPEVALLYSYPDQMVLRRERHHPDFDPLRHAMDCYAAVRSLGVDVDVLDPRRVTAHYPLVVAPHLYLLSDELADRLVAYVRAGGHLLLGPRSGFKDPYSALRPSRQPGTQLSALLGAQVEDFHTLSGEVAVSGPLGSGKCTLWAEYFRTLEPGVETLLTYGAFNGWIDGQPAMLSRAVGQGRITCLGTCLEPTLMQRMMGWALSISGVARFFEQPLPPGVEACRLFGEGREMLFLINHGQAAAEVRLPRLMKRVLPAAPAAASLTLAPQDVVLLTANTKTDNTNRRGPARRLDCTTSA